jgi:hypothetical protein
MKIALIGATGFIGSRLLAELTSRGHQVTAIVRNPEKVAQGASVTAKKGDVYDKDGLAALLAGHDAVISAVHFTASDPATLLAAVKQSGVKRYLVVGGAGSLEVAPGVKVYDTPEFPAIYLDEARKGGVFLDLLKGEGGPRLDLPLALRLDRAGSAHREIPPRQGPAAGRRQGPEPDFCRGLCHCPGRRTGKAGAFASALHGRLLRRNVIDS